MEINVLPDDNFRFGDRVCHPRLGTGRVLRRQEDGTVVIRFDGNSKAVVLFPFQLEHLEVTNISLPPCLIPVEASHG